MNKTELIKKVAERTGLSKAKAQEAVDAFFGSVINALAADQKVSLTGFGTFEVRSRKPRKGRNPQTGQTITIPATKAPAFKPGKGLKERVSA